MTQTSKPRVTLFTSNGAGLGHLTRQLAIALALGDRAHVTIFSLSIGFPLAAGFGVHGEYCPSFTSDWIARSDWDAYLKQRFAAFTTEFRPDVVLFDGVAPYPGFLAGARKAPSAHIGWLRRGMWKPGVNRRQLQKAASFDFVIEPGDLASSIDDGPTSSAEATRVAPVSLMEVLPRLSRQESARELGIDPDRLTLLVTLGSGLLGESHGPTEAALSMALSNDEWQVCVARSPVAPPLSGSAVDDRVVYLDGVYPLSSYHAAFDAAISSAGYNAVHELVPSGVPTLLVANTSAQTDNQVARANYLAQAGLALASRDEDLGKVRKETAKLLGDSTREWLAANVSEADLWHSIRGASSVAGILETTRAPKPDRVWSSPWVEMTPRGVVKALIGRRATNRVRQMLGRTSRTPTTGVTRVALEPKPNSDAVPLEFTEDPSAVWRDRVHPVEHVLTGSSRGYRAERMRIVDEFYDLVR